MDFLKQLKPLLVIILFIWISFFAALVNNYWQTIFLFFLILSLLLIFAGPIVLIVMPAKAGIQTGYYKLIFDKKDIPFWVFLLVMLSGIINVTQPPLAYHHFWYAVFPIPFVFLFAKANFEERQGIVLMRSLCIIASLVSIYGIIEFITKQNFIYMNYIDNLFYLVFKGRRIMSTHMHPVPLGTYLIGVIPLAQGLLFMEKKVVFKSAAAVYAIIIFIGIILTFSRGALLGALAATAIMIFFGVRQKRIFILVLALLGLTIGISSLFFRWGFSPSRRYGLTGLLYAIDRFIMTLQILKEHPFLGVGFGHFRVLFDNYLPHLANVCSYDTKVADCMYLTILTETGLIGFAGFSLFVFSLFKQTGLRLKLMAENEDKILPLCFLAGFIAIICAFLTYDGLYWIAPSYLFWSYAGILAKQRGNW